MSSETAPPLRPPSGASIPDNGFASQDEHVELIPKQARARLLDELPDFKKLSDEEARPAYVRTLVQIGAYTLDRWQAEQSKIDKGSSEKAARAASRVFTEGQFRAALSRGLAQLELYSQGKNAESIADRVHARFHPPFDIGAPKTYSRAAAAFFRTMINGCIEAVGLALLGLIIGLILYLVWPAARQGLHNFTTPAEAGTLASSNPKKPLPPERQKPNLTKNDAASAMSDGQL